MALGGCMSNYTPNHEEVVVHLESGATITLMVPARISILEIRRDGHFVQFGISPIPFGTAPTSQFTEEEIEQSVDSHWDTPEPPDFPGEIDHEDLEEYLGNPPDMPYNPKPNAYSYCVQCDMPVVFSEHALAHGGEWESIPWCSDCRDYHR